MSRIINVWCLSCLLQLCNNTIWLRRWRDARGVQRHSSIRRRSIAYIARQHWPPGQRYQSCFSHSNHFNVTTRQPPERGGSFIMCRRLFCHPVPGWLWRERVSCHVFRTDRIYCVFVQCLISGDKEGRGFRQIDGLEVSWKHGLLDLKEFFFIENTLFLGTGR